MQTHGTRFSMSREAYCVMFELLVLHGTQEGLRQVRWTQWRLLSNCEEPLHAC